MGSKAPPASRAATGPVAESPAAMRAGDVSPRQERLLSEISHELGNYFHKLYYWAELMREQRPPGADAEPATLLERTIRELETFLKSALEYFRPISVVPIAMTVEDVARSVRAVVARHVEPTPLAWRGAVTAAGTVAIDPGRFSFVLEGLVRRVHVGGAAPVTATLETESAGTTGGLVVELAAHGVARGPTDTVGAALEWAILERIVEAHGGDVVAITDDAGRSVRLRLPIAS